MSLGGRRLGRGVLFVASMWRRLCRGVLLGASEWRRLSRGVLFWGASVRCRLSHGVLLGRPGGAGWAVVCSWVRPSGAGWAVVCSWVRPCGAGWAVVCSWGFVRGTLFFPCYTRLPGMRSTVCMVDYKSCLACFAFSSFVLCYCQPWIPKRPSSPCSKIGVVGQIVKVLESRGYTTPANFFWPLKEGSEETLVAILEAAQVDLQSAASKLQSAEAGHLRRLLHECRMICHGPAAVATPAVAPATPAKAPPNLFGLDVGTRLTCETLHQLWSDFGKNFPAEVIDGDTRPCKGLVQMVFAQKASNALRFIPWRQILSEAQADRAKQGGGKENTFLDVLADAEGHVNALEQDPSPSHYGVQRLLMLRSVTWALVGWCHLGAGRRLAQSFVGAIICALKKRFWDRVPVVVCGVFLESCRASEVCRDSLLFFTVLFPSHLFPFSPFTSISFVVSCKSFCVFSSFCKTCPVKIVCGMAAKFLTNPKILQKPCCFFSSLPFLFSAFPFAFLIFHLSSFFLLSCFFSSPFSCLPLAEALPPIHHIKQNLL